jgi:putative FmdB family regulatory protein
MPLYEYRCQRCDQTFEVRQKFSDAPLEVHEGCGGQVERLLSAPALQFKGTGWYVTDYARNGSSASSNGPDKGDAKSDGKSDAKSGAKAETKTESRSESKGETKPSPKAPAAENK